MVPTRFDIDADSDRKTAEYFLDVLYLYLETTEMKKTLMAAAVVLVAGTPLAFAASNGNMSMPEPGSRHCTYAGENFDLCRQDRHKNGGAQPTAGGLTKRH